MNQGYDPYTGAVTAPQTAEQTEAQAGLAALGRGAQGTALQQEALDLQRQQGQKFTPEVAQEYMSPYQTAVTEVEKEKLLKTSNVILCHSLRAQAVHAGGMSGLGSRAGVQAGILGENLQTRLGDIEAKGLQSSFLNAQQQFQIKSNGEAAQAIRLLHLVLPCLVKGLLNREPCKLLVSRSRTLVRKLWMNSTLSFWNRKHFLKNSLPSILDLSMVIPSCRSVM